MAIFDKVIDFLNTPLPGGKHAEAKKEAKAAKAAEKVDVKADPEGKQQAKAIDLQAELRKRDADIRAAAKAAQEDKVRNELLAERRKLRELRREYEAEMAKQAEAHAKAEQMTYTVAAGDTLWAISSRFLGNGARWGEIYEANKDQIKNPNLIYPGQTFIIPDDED
ncbi:MAG: LysM peptidoglycan-binding domain-containing protein [Chloroflexi bacterium]|nr:LysM peptidoglycan-binding domain-containing protein [Chloroflexota bacterium]